MACLYSRNQGDSSEYCFILSTLDKLVGLRVAHLRPSNRAWWYLPSDFSPSSVPSFHLFLHWGRTWSIATILCSLSRAFNTGSTLSASAQSRFLSSAEKRVWRICWQFSQLGKWLKKRESLGEIKALGLC